MYVHNLEKLFKLNGALWVELQADMKKNPRLSVNWSTVKDWDDSRRYDAVEELQAKALHEATVEAVYGVMEWLRGKW